MGGGPGRRRHGSRAGVPTAGLVHLQHSGHAAVHGHVPSEGPGLAECRASHMRRTSWVPGRCPSTRARSSIDAFAAPKKFALVFGLVAPPPVLPMAQASPLRVVLLVALLLAPQCCLQRRSPLEPVRTHKRRRARWATRPCGDAAVALTVRVFPAATQRALQRMPHDRPGILLCDSSTCGVVVWPQTVTLLRSGPTRAQPQRTC